LNERSKLIDKILEMFQHIQYILSYAQHWKIQCKKFMLHFV